MIHTDGDDGLTNPNYDHFESLADRRKLRPVMKSKNICFKRSRGQVHVNNPSCSMTTDLSRSGLYYNYPTEDPDLKLTLMNLIPRNTAQETSEGVQELIKHVSEFIEKKNPFRDVSSSGRKERSEGVHPSSRHSMRSHPSNDTLHSSRKLKSTSEDRRVTKTVQNTADETFTDTVVFGSKSESKSKTLSYANRRCEQMRKRFAEPESKCESMEETQATAKSFLRPSRNSPREKNSPQTDRRATKVSNKSEPGKSPNTKKLKPSEIPLRKNRTDVHKVRQTSHVTMKPVNITTSVHVNTNRKSGANTNREIRSPRDCVSEIDKENRESSSTSRKHTKDKDEGKCDADNRRDTHQSGCTKNPELSNHPPKVRMLDLEQVRSSTFTVLTTLSNTLSRLESIHQQNIDLKENGSDKILGSKSSKLKILTPKSSFNLLKVKSSKKNLSSRLSSKGNKPSLKNKRKRSKTEVGINRTSNLPENFQKTGFQETKWGVKHIAKPILPISDVSTSKSQSLDREKQKQKTTTAKKVDGVSRRSGLTKPKVASPKNQNGPGTPTGFNQKLLVSLCNSALDKPEDNFPTLHKDKEPVVKNNSETLNNITSNFIGSRGVTTGKKKTDGIIIEGSTKTKSSLPVLMEEQAKSRKPEARVETKTKIKKPKDSCKVSVKDLKVIGTAVKLPEEREPDKPKESEKVQLRITIDVKSQEDCSFSGKNITEEGKNVCSFNWLFMNHTKCSRECGQQSKDTKEVEQEITTKEIIKEKQSPPPLDDAVVESVKDELAVSKDAETELQKHYRGSQMMKRRPRPKHKTPNKMNKTKADTKLRSGLTRSFNRDANISSERRNQFDDIKCVKLKRRNSEPISFRGFIWRHQDMAPPRGNKASASSLGSSLKHLNTDDLEDFIFWESVPPRVTSCWETSLYHYKRPWSVLSCSVFKDNRLSNTPGLILENIRNGNSTTRRWPPLQETERVSNSFDVEPSITQKDIDVRNWLADLNLQSPPSTSSDVVREGSVSPQIVSLSPNFKTPVVQKRRKVFPGLKLSESVENKISQDSDKYNSEGSDVGLMELIRRESGGFVTAEQYFNSTRSQSYANSRHKSKPKFHVLEDLEDSDAEKTTESKPQIPKEEKMVQVAFGDFLPSPSHSVEVLESPSSSQDKEIKPSQSSGSANLKTLLLGDTEIVTSNVWKYLFMFTLFVLVTYYVSRSRHSV